MNLTPETKKQAGRIGRVGAVAAMAVLTLGTVDAEPVTGGQYVARAQSLNPAPIAVQASTPIVKTELVAEEAVEAAPTTQTAAPVAKKRSSGVCDLTRIKQKESGGRYNATSKSGKYRGAYQFDQRTWESQGGSGDPAAASPAEQDARAASLYAQRGSQPWNC